MNNAEYGIDFKNNIVYGDGGSVIRWGANFLQDKYHGDYNIFYKYGTGSSDLFKIDRFGGGETNTSLLEWQGFTNQDLNSIEANPLFADDGQTYGAFHLSNIKTKHESDSPAVNFGDEAYALTYTRDRYSLPPYYGATRIDNVQDDENSFDAGFHYQSNNAIAMQCQTRDSLDDASMGSVGFTIDTKGEVKLSNGPGHYTYSTGVSLEENKWTCMEMHIKFHSQDGEASLQIWKDGILIAENDKATLADYEHYSSACNIFGVLNNASLHEQYLYLDEFAIYINETPSNVDADNNFIIGPIDMETDNLPPYQPFNPNPSNAAIDTNITTEISWSGGDPDRDSVTYDVYFGATNPPQLVSEDIDSTHYNPGVLEYNTIYYWQVVASDREAPPISGPMWSFTTEEPAHHAPNEPSNPYPTDGATGRSIITEISWSGGDIDGDTVTYDVYGGIDDDLILFAEDLSATYFNLGALEYNTTYYWKIVANDGEFEVTSDVWSFTTEELVNNPPYQPYNPLLSRYFKTDRLTISKG